MNKNKVQNYIKAVLENMPTGWLELTTHRLDIYEEDLAKTQFLAQFEKLFETDNADTSALKKLPTAYDYIRLGHPLSCVLEWGIAKLNNLKPKEVISFSSRTIPVLAVLRENALHNKNTEIYYSQELPTYFDAETLREVYGYQFTLKQIDNPSEIPTSADTTIFISQKDIIGETNLSSKIDFYIKLHSQLGSIILVNDEQSDRYISAIQHVRRRETIAMTPTNSYEALQLLVGESTEDQTNNIQADKKKVLNSINEITGISTKPLVASSGLSMQYAIMMGLVDDAMKNHEGKPIKFIVPPNCYGGTNDQARRVAESIDQVEIVDLLVDGDNEMVQSIDTILTEIAKENAIPYIIAEIPTNPRVEVPNLKNLKTVLTKQRKTTNGEIAINPVFILDQTFCPNVHFLGEGETLSTMRAISYVSGSKFPSGGKSTAGYCVGNQKTKSLIKKVTKHLKLCDNEATNYQYQTLATQMPSMNRRIKAAYQNTREFVDFIHETLPEAKINFVSKELAAQGFTPSVFSLDLPTRGDTPEEKESYKRALNLRLINLMITKIPEESKFCVSYGQLKGIYWTIPATSTQGTTKEGDKDYIVRVSVSPDVDLERHKKVFLEFVEEL